MTLRNAWYNDEDNPVFRFIHPIVYLHKKEKNMQYIVHNPTFIIKIKFVHYVKQKSSCLKWLSPKLEAT